MKVHRHPVVADNAQHQAGRLTAEERWDMNRRIMCGEGREVPNRVAHYVTDFGHPRRLKVLWRLCDEHTPVIMRVVEALE